MINGRVTGSAGLRRRIATIQAGLPAIVSSERMSEFLLKRIRQRFIDEKDPDGNAWAEHQPSTVKGISILRSTGELFRHLGVIENRSAGFGTSTGAGFRLGVKNGRSQQPGRSRTDNPAAYARYHQLGKGRMRRRFLGIGRLDVKAVDSLLRRELRKLVEGA